MRLSQALSRDTPAPDVVGVFERIFELDEEAGSPMRDYLGFGPEPMEIRRFVQYVRDVVAMSGRPLRGQRVLDAGCGYGLSLVVCGLYGAQSLRGIDIDADAVAFSESYRSVLPNALADHFRLEVGDVARLPYDDASFDLVTSIEAVSHYLDVDRALSELSRVLRPGGSIVLSDGNNARNRRYARTIRELWEAAENGPGHRTIGGHAIGKPYRERREEIIRAQAPDLADADVSRLARATSGFVRDEILDAVKAYDQSGTLPIPKRSADEVPVDPDGATHERLFDPFELGGTLARHGFRDVHVVGYWGGANGRVLVRVANSLLASASRLTMATAKGFRIAAVRS